MCQVKPVVVKNKNAAPPPSPSGDKTDPPVTTGKRVTGASKHPSNKPFKIPRQ